MAVYYIANLQIHDEAGFAAYVEQFGPNFAKTKGKVLAADPAPDSIEGEWPYNRSVILEFPTAEDAHAWHDDPEYQEIKQLRLAASGGNSAIVHGLESPAGA